MGNFQKQTLGVIKRLVRNTLSLSFSQMSRVIFNMVISLLVARLLGVKGFGKYGVLSAYFNIFQVLVVAGLPRLIVREFARNVDARRMWFQRAVLGQFVGAIIGVLLMLAVIVLLKHPPDTTQALFVVALALIPFAISSATETAFQALEKMEYVALVQFIAGLLQVSGCVLVLTLGGGILPLAWMIVVWQSVAALIGVFITLRLGLWQGFRLDFAGVLALFRQSFDFFMLSMSVVLFSRLDVLILSQMLGEEAVGVYNAAYLVVRVVNYLSISYSNAAYPVLSRWFDESVHHFKRLLSKSLLLGTIMMVLAASLLAVEAPSIINLIYPGEGYQTSALLLRIEALFVLIFFWNSFLSSGLMASNQQRRSVVVSSVKLLLGFIYYFGLTAWLGLVGTAIATVLGGLTGTLLNYYFFNRDVYRVNLFSLLGKLFGVGLLLLGFLWLIQGLAWPLVFLLGSLFYALLLILTGLISKEDLGLVRQIFLSF